MQRAEDTVIFSILEFSNQNNMDLLLPHLGLIVWTLLAFLIVFFILKKYAWKPILKSLGEREDNIANSIATAEKVKLEMAQLKNDNEALLAQTREERATLLKEAKETKDKIINDAKEQAKDAAAKIVAEAQASINHQKMAAITELKNQVGQLVIEVSEKVIRRELSNKAEQENYIKELAKEAKLN
jgi:F-type H+-transporting ATPase subunit b